MPWVTAASAARDSFASNLSGTPVPDRFPAAFRRVESREPPGLSRFVIVSDDLLFASNFLPEFRSRRPDDSTSGFLRFIAPILRHSCALLCASSAAIALFQRLATGY
jgi:hypothetical protein